jgi:hypothetical protein
MHEPHAAGGLRMTGPHPRNAADDHQIFSKSTHIYFERDMGLSAMRIVATPA